MLVQVLILFVVTDLRACKLSLMSSKTLVFESMHQSSSDYQTCPYVGLIPGLGQALGCLMPVFSVLLSQFTGSSGKVSLVVTDLHVPASFIRPASRFDILRVCI